MKPLPAPCTLSIIVPIFRLVRKGHRPVEIPVNYRSRSFKEGKKIRIFYDPLTWLVAWVRSRFGPL